MYTLQETDPTPDKLRGLKGLYRAEILRLREAGVKEFLGLPDMKKTTKATSGAATMRTQSLGWSEDGTTNSTSYRGLHTLYLVSTLGGQTGALHNPPASKANPAAKPPSRTSSRRSEEGEVKEEEEAEDEAAPADPNEYGVKSATRCKHLKEFLGEEYEAAHIAWCTGAPPPAPKEPPSKAKATTVKEEAVKVEETVEETRSFDKHRWSMTNSLQQIQSHAHRRRRIRNKVPHKQLRLVDTDFRADSSWFDSRRHPICQIALPRFPLHVASCGSLLSILVHSSGSRVRRGQEVDLGSPAFELLPPRPPSPPQKKSNGRWPSTCKGPFGTTRSDNPTRQAPPSIGYVRALNVRLQQRSTMCRSQGRCCVLVMSSAVFLGSSFGSGSRRWRVAVTSFDLATRIMRDIRAVRRGVKAAGQQNGLSKRRECHSVFVVIG
ncbi:hypothetical protein DFP72DRAFT_851858 [Ephemerocybe angulata]|uniref:Uncharacterized protein n=1 Tax=Ephemerocybe angulata TaxID=980116 RepID=A0A8H6M3G3_9AGAR|nr:hypothetical protein DFP72DRAFT_851858 [Tulosesus angulatus]